MGLIRATTDAIGGALADQWQEILQADDMGDNTIFTKAKFARAGGRGSNTKGEADVISNGSHIFVKPGQFMMLVDGGKIVDYTAEPGTYVVNNSSAPSMFNGEFKESLKESFRRIKFGGDVPHQQMAYFINLQEIKGIKFGTPNPVTYYDQIYDADLSLRAHGTYSIRVTDPIKFYTEVIPKDMDHVEVQDVNLQYLTEFLSALQTALGKLSADGVRISQVAHHSAELSKEMSEVLDEDWNDLRGMEIVRAAIASITLSEDSQELINMRSKGAMLKDASIREGYVQGSVARGLEAAGSNEGGAGNAFIGMGMGMNMGGLGSFSETNRQQMQEQQARQQQQGGAPQNFWFCTECGAKNTGKFCSECGAKRQVPDQKVCSNCGYQAPAGSNPKFCPECGTKFE